MAVLDETHPGAPSMVTRRIENSAPPDVSKLSFPLQVVVLIVTTVLSVTGAQMATSLGMRSDIRDIATRMEMREEQYKKDLANSEISQMKQEKQIAELRSDMNGVILALERLQISSNDKKR